VLCLFLKKVCVFGGGLSRKEERSGRKERVSEVCVRGAKSEKHKKVMMVKKVIKNQLKGWIQS